MKKEDIEILSFDDLEEEEFMLNDKSQKKEEKPQIVEEIIEDISISLKQCSQKIISLPHLNTCSSVQDGA